ncbi:MAG: GNAT family N-acetyltransferase, partial [Chloroflexi bacterium]
VRGRDSVDMDALEALMVLFGELVVEHKWIKEIDINPLFASSDQIVALDARVVLYEPDVDEADLPKLAIRPYPSQYVDHLKLNGDEFTIRPIRPEDEPAVIRYHETLSEKSVYLRYFRAFQLSQRVEHERMTRICFVDYDRDMALVIERENPRTGENDIIGIGRLTKERLINEAEFAIMVSDAHQGKGLGTEILTRLLQIGRDEGIAKVNAYMLGENMGMRNVCDKLGFSFEREDELIKASIDL